MSLDDSIIKLNSNLNIIINPSHINDNILL